MRIISQSGTDYPYEQICIQIQNNQIKCKTCNSDRVDLLAVYSSAEKARKAMEMLHMGYLGLMPSLIISDCGISIGRLGGIKTIHGWRSDYGFKPESWAHRISYASPDIPVSSR